MDYETVADELYGLPLAEFTPTRTAREKEAKAAGDRALVTAIHALAKPNQVAWTMNRLARERRADLQSLAQLGESVRSGGTAPDAGVLRDVARQEREQVRAILAGFGEVDGLPARPTAAVAQGIEETLHAVVVDPDSARAVLGGRLTAGLQFFGFTMASSGRATPALTLVPGGAESVEERSKQAEGGAAASETADAEAAAAAARLARDEAGGERDAARQVLAKADDKVERLRAKLNVAITDSKRARREYDKTSAAYDKAVKAAKEAQTALTRRKRN